MEIDIFLRKELLEKLESKLEEYGNVSKQFIIQYTFFEKENNKWIMKNFLDIGKEKLKKICLKICDDATNIIVYAHNPNFGIMKIDKKLDMKNKSTPNRIYACDLYDEFVACHYYGKCYTSK